MIGITLGNRYEIIEQVGEGGMAIVYKAKCHLLNRFVAIKVLRDEFTNDEEFIRKFRRESQAAASLSHPNILNIYDVGVEDIENKKIHYIVMEFIDGYTLKEVIKEKGKLDYDETINYSIQIAEALHHAHKNHIVHRDIKPHNIMITNDNRLKVTDFGIARAVTSSTVTTTSNVLGSVHYFSPEQARGGYTDEKSDIYSLGIVMYEMITGKVPYDGESPISVALKHIQDNIVPPSEVDSTVPYNLEKVILKCVQKTQSDRYNSIADLIRDLKNIRNPLAEKKSHDNEIDSATRIIPALDFEGDEVMNMKSEDKKSRKDKDLKKTKKSKGSGGVVFLGILLAFLLVTSIFFGYSKLKAILETEEITVPSLIGKEEEIAKAEIEALSLVFNVTDRVKSNDYEAGVVIYQSVEENSKVKSGYPINVTISEGANLVSVPLLLNKTIEEAEVLLKQNDLNVGTVDPEFNDSIPEGKIIKQDPEALTEIGPGSRVNIVVSQGPEIKNVIMPDLINKSITEARNALVAMELVVGDVTSQPSDNVEKDLVIWQSYEKGTELETGTAVDLYISSGPSSSNEPDPNAEPGGNNDVDVQTPITLTPFADREETEIKIFRIQEGVTETVYNKRHKASDGSFVETLTSKPGARFDIYFDGVFQGSIPASL